mgnify:CR=1 FL=1
MSHFWTLPVGDQVIHLNTLLMTWAAMLLPLEKHKAQGLTKTRWGKCGRLCWAAGMRRAAGTQGKGSEEMTVVLPVCLPCGTPCALTLCPRAAHFTGTAFLQWW